MSTFSELDITCSDCGEEYKGTIWTAVHAGQDPELKDLLLGGELNLLMCPKCSSVAYQDHFILYQDPAAELVAYIYPPQQKIDEPFLRETTLANFKEAQAVYKPKDRKTYEPMIVFGLETFIEKMEKESFLAEQSQIAEAICKDNKIPYVLLRPSEARKLGTVRVLPGVSREKKEILKGIQKLLDINPSLDLYVQLAESLSNPATPQSL